tara:strand:+ start:5739 stop:6371 length:633 start_codon:yes stop_codon:yes gene_type:complete
MKNYIQKIFTIISILGLISFSTSPKIKNLKIREKVSLTSIKMKAATGQDFSLEDLVLENGMLVIFSCNTCPFVIGNNDMEGWQGRYNEIYDVCKKNRIGMVLVNSNKAKRDMGDSFTDMQVHSTKNNYDAPYVLDKNHQLADAFGASTTPHVFLLNNQFQLIYKGAIDDNVSSKAGVKENWLTDALESAGNKELIAIAETRNSGCSIKRK